ncbi:hypothetical protein [Haladaptatus sp. DYF46]|uniref:hypothetical protein n=1 Tax=unclassified Haladaptatus TaxID=2622732 RepID=UPI001E53DF2F|nr:hypothetical protein [Haladaptatus sp. DYF46]
MGTTHSTYGNKPRTAPLGIKILCVLAVISGVLGLFGGFVALFSSPVGFIVGIVAMVLSAAQLVVAWGLWTLQPWAWTLTLIVYGLSLLSDVFKLLTGNGFAIISIIIGVLLLAYVYGKRDYYK